MPNDQYAAFMTGGMAILVAAAIAIAWILWRERDSRIDSARAALEGLSHEYRINVQRFITELSMAARGELPGASALLPISHPQMDGVNGSLIETNRKALAVINASYLELAARKELLRQAFQNNVDVSQDMTDAMDATVDALATLYMWEEHNGVSPHEARSTRSWYVRDWMKDHRFQVDAFPGLHLRDQVVERLRSYGMPLTPKPLTHTAHEFYSMQYDRYADPRSPFGRRKTDEDGNVIRKERRLKLPKMPSRKTSEANGSDEAIEEHTSEPSPQSVRESRLSRLKLGRGGDSESEQGGERFSFGKLVNKVRGRGKDERPQGD